MNFVFLFWCRALELRLYTLIYPHVIFTARRSHILYIEVDETVSGCFDLSPSFSLIGSQALLTGQTALFIG